MNNPGPHDLDLSEIDKQEASCLLNAFNADLAFELGCLLRENARKYDRPVLIQISSPLEVVYFQCCSRPGVIPDNEGWAKRKRNTVVHFNRSTFYIGCKIRGEHTTMEEAFKLSENQYACHGGGFPLRVRGSEGIQAIVIVSGLPQHLDHDLIVSSVLEFIKRQES